MNFLSTGEKIKRARVYKGLTLKELCKQDISISRMSCIENGKVVPEEWVLELVAERLGLDLQYLLCDDKSELKKSIEKYSQKNYVYTNEDFNTLIENYEYCSIKEYTDFAFKFMHILFKGYTNQRRFDKITPLVDLYTDLYENKECYNNLYYSDLAFYFMIRGSFQDATTYFTIYLNNELENNEKEYYNKNIMTIISLAICYFSAEELKKCEDILQDLLNISNDIEDVGKISLAKGIIAAINILKNESFEREIKVFDEYSNKYEEYAALINICIAKSYFKIKDNNGIKRLIQAKNNIYQDNSWKYTEVLLTISKIFLDNCEIDLALANCEEALQRAIEMDNIVFIEKAYFIRGKIHKIKNSVIQWEMDMNLATDLLMKFGTCSEKYERYLEMANMYHIIGDTRDSLKYISLALVISKDFD
ncbi:helix-turn-helix domain-containing protein [Clostridium tarantellae]|uniref:Helix-turn-helix domain-containing protein n=1 Tax=Clostridium tarantellae TaxID=39493 RepID=A0A6I1ML00_9CLOT|nr:helix-turn-helix transcriptional regulator [Clostridium tarantellae]MPQ43128.1 helix-turn-helix domain-containing protein [Clostridium tarantellae]